MAELQRGSAAILERDEEGATTSTKPELEPVARETRIGGGTQDSSITVIENPSLHGYTGLLLARFFEEKFQSKTLLYVHHFRIDNTHKVEREGAYTAARIEKGFDAVPYNFVVSNRGAVLPTPSILPYEICFLSPDDYVNALYDLQNRSTRESVEHIYQLIAGKVTKFSFEDGKLVLPEDYASYAIGEMTTRLGFRRRIR